MKLQKILFPLAFAYFGFLVFSHLGDTQLEFFDEARRGVNALEMYSGFAPHPLVPTYAGSPEHWGTKPPLLIWLQVAAVAILGPTELAIRLPAALATLAAIALMLWFSARQQQSPFVGLLAGWILLCNWNFVGNHGARSGDFDALLLLFTLAQLLFFFHWTRSGQNRYLVLASLALLLAGWTKGIAGCFLLPALGLWVLLDTQARKQLLNTRMYLAFGLGLLGILSFYLLREAIDPGFLREVWDNELGGRYWQVNEGHSAPWHYYLSGFLEDATFLPIVLLSFPAAAWLHAQQQARGPASLLLIGSLFYIGILSCSATKLYWYITPILPFLALLVSEWLYSLSKDLKAKLPPEKPWQHAVLVSLLLLFLLGPASIRLLHKVTNAALYLGMKEHLSYRSAIQNTAIPTPYTVLPWHYHANARFYVLQQQLAGRDIQIQGIKRLILPYVSKEVPAAQLVAGQRVLICENQPWIWMAEHYHYNELAAHPPCKLVEIGNQRSLE